MTAIFDDPGVHPDWAAHVESRVQIPNTPVPYAAACTTAAVLASACIPSAATPFHTPADDTAKQDVSHPGTPETP